MDIVTDIEQVKLLAGKKEDENWRFRAFLKASDISHARLDRTVKEYYEPVAAKIDCGKCANCCKTMSAQLSKRDLKPLADHLHLSKDELISEYLQPGEEKGKYAFRQVPCPFLKEGRCSVHDARPANCKSFPNLHKRDFRSRLIQVVQNATVCPIVYHVLELLKLDLWRGRRRW